MATGNEMEAGPPELIERVVRLLLPPPAREHVLGDLAERYVSPGQYLGEALRTLPFIITSQIRRTTNIAAFPIVAVVMMMGFDIAGRGHLASAAIATGVTLLGYMLRDAYRTIDLRHLWRQGLIDTLVVAAFLVASQALLAMIRPDWVLSGTRALSGSIMLGLIYLLRVQNPSGRVPQSAAPSGGAMTLEELRTEVRFYAQHARRTMAIEVGVGLVIVPVFAATAIVGRPWPARVGAALAILGIAFVVWYMRRNARWRVPVDVGFAETVAAYRARLERSHASLLNVWWWYLLPLGIGPTVIIVGAATVAARSWMETAPVVGMLAVLGLFIGLMSRRAAHGVRRRIDALAVVEERR